MFVSVSGDFNHNRLPLLLDSNKLVCHANTTLLKVCQAFPLLPVQMWYGPFCGL